MGATANRSGRAWNAVTTVIITDAMQPSQSHQQRPMRGEEDDCISDDRIATNGVIAESPPAPAALVMAGGGGGAKGKQSPTDAVIAVQKLNE